MRVLHAINQLSGRAGAEVSLRDIITHDVSGIEHGVVVLSRDRNVLGPFHEARVPCFVPAALRLSRGEQIRHVRAAIRRFRPDLVHTTLFEADVAGRIAGFMESVPTVSSIVNTSYAPEVAVAESVSPYKLRAVRWVDRVLARSMASGFHAISNTTANHAVQFLGVPRERIRVVPRGRSRADLGEMSSMRRDAVRGALGWGTRPVVINVARQEPQKGQRYLVEAFPHVLERLPAAKLVLVGREGRSTPELESLIAGIGIDDSVERLGVRNDVPDLLAGADLFAFPSLYEGLGGAVVEALWFGMPIVASDIPALREVVGQDRGWLVPPADSDRLAATLLEVLKGGDEVSRRSKEARRAFLESYELDGCIRGMVSLYVDIERQLPEKRRARHRPVRFRLEEA